MTFVATKIFACRVGARVPMPTYLCTVSAGYPSPAEDWLEDALDLNDLLVKNPPATFLLRVSGDSMRPGGIHDGSVLVVDRSVAPKPGNIVVAAVEGQLTVKRLAICKTGQYLKADNSDYPDIPVNEDTVIWGVVTSTILKF